MHILLLPFVFEEIRLKHGNGLKKKTAEDEGQRTAVVGRGGDAIQVGVET